MLHLEHVLYLLVLGKVLRSVLQHRVAEQVRGSPRSRVHGPRTESGRTLTTHEYDFHPPARSGVSNFRCRVTVTRLSSTQQALPPAAARPTATVAGKRRRESFMRRLRDAVDGPTERREPDDSTSLPGTQLDEYLN